MLIDIVKRMSQGADENGPSQNGISGEPSVHMLRLFLVLGEELHFGRAAARLFMTQPALSRQIRALEDHLGVSLIERTTRTTALTEAGEALLSHAHVTVEAMDQLCHTAELHARDIAGRLVIGSVGALAAVPRVHAVLDHLRTNHPRLHIEVRSVNFTEQTEELLNGRIDVAFLRPPLPVEIRTLALFAESRVAAISGADPLVSRSNVTLADLAHHRVLDVPHQVPREWRDYWAVNPRPDGSPVRFGPAVNDVESLLLAVARGHGIAFLPAGIRIFFPRPGVHYIDVTDLSPTSAALAWLRKNSTRPNVAAVRNAAQAVLCTTEPKKMP
jgi:DNA-binding transcriptional LysR family regulator